MGTLQSRASAPQRLRVRLVAAIGAVAVAYAVSAAPALAGECSKTSRNARIDNQALEAGAAADTTVVNRTAQGQYYVEIYTKKNDVAGADFVRQQYGSVKENGAQVSKKIGGVEDITFMAVISSLTGGDASSTCSYQLKVKDKKSTWDLVDPAKTACAGALKVTCSKSFRSGAARWNTTFEISD